MARLRSDEVLRQRLVNLAQAGLLLAALAVMLGLFGWLFAGTVGVVWALALVALTAAIGGRIPARVVLARSGARPIAFNRAPGLYRVVEALARRAGLEHVPALHWVPSHELNAFAVGNRSEGGIAITEGLLSRLGDRELIGVLAHEISHLKNNDTWVMSLASLMTRLTLWLATFAQILLILYLPWVLAGELAGLWLWLLLIAFVPTLGTLAQLALSRNREFAADLEAAALTGDPEGLARALAVLEAHHGAWIEAVFLPHGPLPDLKWLRTHPPTAERIRRLQSISARPREPFPLHDHPGPYDVRGMVRPPHHRGGWWSL